MASIPTETPKFDSRYANRILILFAGIVAIVLYIEGMLTPSLPAIASSFEVTIAQVSLVIALYAVSGTALNPIVGKLGDIYGKKKVLTYVITIYAIAVCTTSFVPNFTLMLISRTIQGVGLAIQPLLMSIIREEFPKESIPKAQGILSAMFGIGFAVSLPLGALISNNFGWQTTYHTAIPFVIAFVIMVFLLVKESPYKKPNVKVDYFGAALMGASIVMVVLALAQGSNWGWTSISTLSLVTGGLALLAPLLIYERRYLKKGGEPILNLKLLSIRNVIVANLTLLIVSIGMYLAFQAYVYKFELPAPFGYGLDIAATGLSLVPLALAMIIFAPIAGISVTKIGVKRTAIPGAIASVIAFYLSALATSYTEHLVLMFIAGAGLSIAMASIINLLVLTVNPQDMGLATSMNTVFRNLGSSLGTPIAAAILSTFTVSIAVGNAGGQTMYRSFPSNTAFEYSFYVAAAVFIVLIILTLMSNEVLGKKTNRTQIDAKKTQSNPKRSKSDLNGNPECTVSKVEPQPQSQKTHKNREFNEYSGMKNADLQCIKVK